jgi:hypothetical protein
MQDTQGTEYMHAPPHPARYPSVNPSIHPVVPPPIQKSFRVAQRGQDTKLCVCVCKSKKQDTPSEKTLSSKKNNARKKKASIIAT